LTWPGSYGIPNWQKKKRIKVKEVRFSLRLTEKNSKEKMESLKVFNRSVV
jgi:hypothetical protein